MPNRKNKYADMDKYRKTRKEQNRKYYKKTASVYPRKIWTLEEEKMVMEHSIPDSELSKLICRSVGAIQKRRNFLKN